MSTNSSFLSVCDVARLFISADDVFSLEGVAGPTPFDFLRQFGGPQDLRESPDFILPLPCASNVVIDRFVSFHTVDTSTGWSCRQFAMQ